MRTCGGRAVTFLPGVRPWAFVVTSLPVPQVLEFTLAGKDPAPKSAGVGLSRREGQCSRGILEPGPARPSVHHRHASAAGHTGSHGEVGSQLYRAMPLGQGLLSQTDAMRLRAELWVHGSKPETCLASPAPQADQKGRRPPCWAAHLCTRSTRCTTSLSEMPGQDSSARLKAFSSSSSAPTLPPLCLCFSFSCGETGA